MHYIRYSYTLDNEFIQITARAYTHRYNVYILYNNIKILTIYLMRLCSAREKSKSTICCILDLKKMIVLLLLKNLNLDFFLLLLWKKIENGKTK